jgi:hypothetical protein
MLVGPQFTTRTAGDREAGARCPHCSASIAYDEQIAGCLRCGAVHHLACWHSHDGCGSFECAPARRILGAERPPDLRVTMDEVQWARPQPRGVLVATGGFAPSPSSPPTDRRQSSLAVAGFMVALVCAALPALALTAGAAAGLILLGGMAAGVLAILLCSLALANVQHSRRRGLWLAAVGVVLGLVGTVVSIGLIASVDVPNRHLAVSIDQFEPDADSLNHMVPAVARAARANALIEVRLGGGVLAGQGIGSGVIMQIENGAALILTNRHVVDPNFGEESAAPKPALPDGRLQVKLIGQSAHPGQVVWIAPDGIDLALLRVDIDGDGARAARWSDDTELMVGSEVFTIGNPQHLDWTHTRGSISQLRLQRRGDRQIHVIQTDAPLNPGNSGGGLYDKSGTLIGINTWTNDKRFSEGIGFAIALKSLLDLAPPELQKK